jgi:hypothetical protein
MPKRFVPKATEWPVPPDGALTGLGITPERVRQWLGAELKRLAEAKHQAAAG